MYNHDFQVQTCILNFSKTKKNVFVDIRVLHPLRFLYQCCILCLHIVLYIFESIYTHVSHVLLTNITSNQLLRGKVR